MSPLLHDTQPNIYLEVKMMKHKRIYVIQTMLDFFYGKNLFIFLFIHTVFLMCTREEKTAKCESSSTTHQKIDYTAFAFNLKSSFCLFSTHIGPYLLPRYRAKVFILLSFSFVTSLHAWTNSYLLRRFFLNIILSFVLSFEP